MAERARGTPFEPARSSPAERNHAHHKSDSSDYIKICIDEEASPSPALPSRRTQDSNLGKRFTFNRNSQDTIKEDHENSQIIRPGQPITLEFDDPTDLRKALEALRAENARLVEESAQNMELFNGYMREMEQRATNKNKEIEALKNKLREAEEKLQRSEERVKSTAAKIPNNGNFKNNKRECAVQCEPRYRWFNGYQEQRKIQPDGKELQIKILQKENQLMQREIVSLRQSQESLAESFQKELRLCRAEQESQYARTSYYRTLASSPRSSLTKNVHSLTDANSRTDALSLNFNANNTINALISPRTNSRSRPPLDPSARGSRHEKVLMSTIESKLDRLISQSGCGSGLQFDRSEGRRLKNGRA